MAETYLDLFTVLLSNADYVIPSIQISHLSFFDGQVQKYKHASFNFDTNFVLNIL